jgi:hypothetical protein
MHIYAVYILHLEPSATVDSRNHKLVVKVGLNIVVLSTKNELTKALKSPTHNSLAMDLSVVTPNAMRNTQRKYKIFNTMLSTLIT